MKTISLTVPIDYNTLTRTSEMLKGLAIDLKLESAPEVSVEAERKPPNALVGTPEPAPVAETVFAYPKPEPVEEAESATTAVSANGAVDTAPAYTDPAVLVPWDSRIHSGTPYLSWLRVLTTGRKNAE